MTAREWLRTYIGLTQQVPPLELLRGLPYSREDLLEATFGLSWDTDTNYLLFAQTYYLLMDNPS